MYDTISFDLNLMFEHAGSIRQSWFHGITRETYNLLGDSMLWGWMIMNRDQWPGCQSLCHKSSISWTTLFYFDVIRCYVAVVKLATEYCRMMSCHRKIRCILVFLCSIDQMSTWTPGPWFSIKMSSYQYRKSHCGDKTVLRSSYLHNGICFIGKMSSLYWIGALGSLLLTCINFNPLIDKQLHPL